MSLPRRQRRLLTRIDDAESRSDPRLARMMAGFARLTDEGPMPGHEALRCLTEKIRALLLTAVTAVITLIARASVRLARVTGAAALFRAASRPRRRHAAAVGTPARDSGNRRPGSRPGPQTGAGGRG